MMSGQEYRRRVEALGYRPGEFAEALGATSRAGQKWALNGPSRVVEIILRLIDKRPDLHKALLKAAAESEIRQ